jgi:hypothetical protein
MINTPGAGMNLPFFEDPTIRIQKWGANLHTNTVNIESDFFGLTRKANRDLIGYNDYKLNAVKSEKIAASTNAPFVEESRATHPAWMYRDLEQSRWSAPWLNPLNDIEMKFNTNIQTRILEKDNFISN